MDSRRLSHLHAVCGLFADCPACDLWAAGIGDASGSRVARSRTGPGCARHPLMPPAVRVLLAMHACVGWLHWRCHQLTTSEKLDRL
mmetsp:Transcript_18927/g.28184  ORF Transcript_18927/g.28184 Transcript_18927/m.28184 type:complete len:86 (-) Transcript_18927:99-356(-)